MELTKSCTYMNSRIITKDFFEKKLYLVDSIEKEQEKLVNRIPSYVENNQPFCPNYKTPSDTKYLPLFKEQSMVYAGHFLIPSDIKKMKERGLLLVQKIMEAHCHNYDLAYEGKYVLSNHYYKISKKVCQTISKNIFTTPSKKILEWWIQDSDSEDFLHKWAIFKEWVFDCYMSDRYLNRQLQLWKDMVLDMKCFESLFPEYDMYLELLMRNMNARLGYALGNVDGD